MNFCNFATQKHRIMPKIEDDILIKFTHRFKLDPAHFKVKDHNFDLQYHDACFEFKKNAAQFDAAFAEVLLNSGKQKMYFSRYVIVYTDDSNDFVCLSFDYSDAFFANMSIKFENETPSQPSEEARRFFGGLQKTVYFNRYLDRDDLFGQNEIRHLITEIELNRAEIDVTIDNAIRVFNEWRQIAVFCNVPTAAVSDDTLVQLSKPTPPCRTSACRYGRPAKTSAPDSGS